MTLRKKLGVGLMGLGLLVVLAGAGLTIWSLTHGVGQFAEFLRGEVTSDMIKVQVELITSELGSAWISAAVGLVAGLSLGLAGLLIYLLAPRPVPPPLPVPDERVRGNEW